MVVKGDRNYDEGAYELSIKDNAVAASNQIACDDDGGAIATSSKITRTLAAGTYYVVVSAGSAAASGNYTLRFRDASWYGGYGEIACDNDSGPGSTSLIERQLTAGNYHVIVKGRSSLQSGLYQLRVTDVNPPPEAIPAITCDDDSAGSSQARIVRSGTSSLPAGDYWVVLKGDNDTSSGTYTVNIKDMNANASGAIIACDDDSGDQGSSVIERDLDRRPLPGDPEGRRCERRGRVQALDARRDPPAVQPAQLRQRQRRGRDVRTSSRTSPPARTTSCSRATRRPTRARTTSRSAT